MKQILTLFTLLISSSVISLAESTPKETSAGGIFVSFKDGTLTLKGKSGPLVYQQVGANYKTYQNNEKGPGAKLVDTVTILQGVAPGMVFYVNTEEREISFGLDHRVIGTFESYEAGNLKLLAVEVPQGFIKKPAGNISLKVDPGIPVLSSTNGGFYKHAGSAGEALKTVKAGTILTARSEYDIDNIEIIQIGDPRQVIERYIGQTRGTVRGTFVAFKDGIIQIRGKGLSPMAANEYERLVRLKITADIPVVESIDGAAFKPASVEALKNLKEGAIVTIRKVEEVILEVQIGAVRKN